MNWRFILFSFLVLLVFVPVSFSRFTSVDPKRQFPNPYSYVGNNPIQFSDPNGQEIEVEEGIVDLIKMTLPEQLQEFVVVGDDNRLVLSALVSAYDKIDESHSDVLEHEFFLKLIDLMKNPEVVLVKIGEFSFLTGDGKEFNTPAFQFLKPEDSDGYNQGLLGYTFVPSKTLLNGSGQLLPNETFPISGNIEVRINKRANTNTRALSVGHELYSHVWLYLAGKPFIHTGYDSTSGKSKTEVMYENINMELKRQISGQPKK